MESNFSHVSDEDEELRRMTLSFDDETLNFEFECPIHDLVSNVAVVQRRAAQ